MPTFQDYFKAIHGVSPFPWQERLARQLMDTGWPQALALPTAAGKTACLDIATWALACEAAKGATKRRMPRRIVLVVDRRIVVDDAFARARKIADAISKATEGPLLAVREALRLLGGEIPLHATVLRGGILRDERWARTPLQPTLVVSTVDQVGSRLLFRGYGLSEGQRPIHAGLLAYDTLLILDEAHLSRPFEETLEWIKHHRALGERPIDLPFEFVRMTATPPSGGLLFEADPEDRGHPVLGRRISASKPSRILEPVDQKKAAATIAREVAAHARQGMTIAVVVNRVTTARQVYTSLSDPKLKLGADVILLTGRSRPHERDQLIARWSDRLRSGRDRQASAAARPLVLVSTQCIEAGADLDFDYLVTECAPLDALRQRFGRLDRLGELAPLAAGEDRAAIFIDSKSAKDSTEDPIYGSALKNTWDWISSRLTNGMIDFGISALKPPEGAELDPLLSPRASAPLLQRAYCDLLSQTSPEPEPSPDPAAFLHGIERNDPEVQLVWRADLGNDPALWADVVSLCPPVVGEVLPLRLSVVRAWLGSLGQEQVSVPDDADLEGLVPAVAKAPKPEKVTQPKSEEEEGDDAETEELPAEEAPVTDAILPVLRWAGTENSSVLTRSSEIRPGDTLIVPAQRGGCDDFGWDPSSKKAVIDIAQEARLPAFAPVLRLNASLFADNNPIYHAFADLLRLRELPEEGLRERVEEALNVAEPTAPVVVGALRSGYRIDRHPAGGIVLTGRSAQKSAATFSDVDDSSSSRAGRITLASHSRQVSTEAERYAALAGLPKDTVEVFRLAGLYHDLGKADPRFQAWLAGGNRLLALREMEPLAKSDRLGRGAVDLDRSRIASGYPKGARHELLSTRLVEGALDRMDGLSDRDLLLHLLASHHGRCRPFAPVVEDEHPVMVTCELDGFKGSTSSATGLERIDSGVSRRFFRLMRRYGWWGLAYLEALLRLADHRVSERAQGED